MADDHVLTRTAYGAAIGGGAALWLLAALLFVSALLAGCAASDSKSTTLSDHYQIKTVSKLFSDVEYSDIFVRTDEGEYEYLGTVGDSQWAERKLGFGGLVSKKLVVSSDGRSIVYEHDAKAAGDKATKETGLYHYEVGIGEKLIFRDAEFTIPASRFPKPLPSDVLVISRRGVPERDEDVAVSADGDIVPLLVLGGTMLHRAAFSGESDAIAQLGREQADLLDLENHWNLTALEIAVVTRNESVALQLLSLGADIRTTQDETSLIFLASARRCPAVVDALLDKPVSYDFTTTDGNTPLHALARVILPHFFFVEGRISDFDSFAATLDVYMKHGADINQRDGNGRTLLHFSSTYGPNVPMVERLTDYGINVELQDLAGNTALHQAAGMGATNERIWNDHMLPHVRMIAGRMQSVDVENMHGLTPLQIAVQSNSLRIADYLISLGADATVLFVPRPNIEAVEGQTIQERIDYLKETYR